MKVNLDDERLFDAIAGAGAHAYPWYVKFDPDWDERRLRVGIEFEDVTADKVVTVADMRTVIENRGPWRNVGSLHTVDWSDEECDSDVDADVADQVIQTAALGEVVFG